MKTNLKLGYIALFPYISGLFAMYIQSFYMRASLSSSYSNTIYFYLQYGQLFTKFLIGILAVAWFYLILHNPHKHVKHILLANSLLGVVVSIAMFYFMNVGFFGADFLMGSSSDTQWFYDLFQIITSFTLNSDYLLFLASNITLCILLYRKHKQPVPILVQAAVQKDILSEPQALEEPELAVNEEVQLYSSSAASEPTYEQTTAATFSFTEDTSEDEPWKPRT